MSYEDYIQRLCDSGNRLALIVKKADLENNMDPNRLALIGSEKKQSVVCARSMVQHICLSLLR